jgi:NAD-dependent SIR2 family protein deacetylase
MTNYFIPCQHCGKTYPQYWKWFICDQCRFRVCPQCLSQHRGRYGQGFKCSKCAFGQMRSGR